MALALLLPLVMFLSDGSSISSTELSSGFSFCMMGTDDVPLLFAPPLLLLAAPLSFNDCGIPLVLVPSAAPS